MQMRNALTAVLARIHDETKTRFGNSEFFSEFRHHVNENVRGKFLIFRLEVRDTLNMFLRDNQNVHGSFGRQVFERDNAVVLVNRLRRNLARRNFAKDTIGRAIATLIRLKIIRREGNKQTGHWEVVK